MDIVALVSNYRFLPASIPELEAEVRATITIEQTWRFELYVSIGPHLKDIDFQSGAAKNQEINISMVPITLRTFRQQMAGLKEDLPDDMQETLDITREEAEERLKKDMLRRGQLKPGLSI